MDEPTTALDVVTQREIISELFRLRDELGFAMFITHDLSLLTELADEIAVMYAGALVERAGSESLFRAPRHPYTFGLLNSFPPMHGERKAMTGIPGSPPDLRDPVRVRVPPALPARHGPVLGGRARAGAADHRAGAARPQPARGGLLAARPAVGEAVPDELNQARSSRPGGPRGGKA